MDIAHSIALLNAHQGVLEAEISRIDSDVSSLKEVAARYPPDSELASSAKAARLGLLRLRATKEKLLAEVRQQVELFRLHLPAAAQLLRRLGATQDVALPASAFPPPTANVTGVVVSRILAPPTTAPLPSGPSGLYGPSSVTVVTPERRR